ncbi:MAG: EpsG family protein [Bacteroides sp.]|nr:EpsG family protein [Eubacterium sp.]MCM1418396.1 EpsG family protein [Roseburia sp.]MCM1462497.1 EpsG family protein [Bacteroides sp.]
MIVYILLFALAILLAVPLVMKDPTPVKKTVYLAIMFILMYLVSVLRYGIGNDYFSYIRIFRQIDEAGVGELFTIGFEPLFTLLTKGITLLTDDPTFMYAIYAALILAPVAWAIRKYSDNVWLSVVVYLCLTLFYNSLNFIRQSMAASLLLLAYGFMKEKKVVPVLIFGVCAIFFHYTAAAFIPLYLLALVRPTKKSLILYGSVSVGALVVFMILRAAGADPLNLAADLATAVTGKDYASYIDSIYFTPLGVEYLIMPLLLLAIVLIAYFSGWKEKKDADLLLQLTVLNTSVWLFIVYALVVERFSLFILIFAVFTLPSITEYFAEKARAAEKAETVNKKIPGYSKKKSEEKKDNSFLITVGIAAGLFIYNCWGMAMNFHGVFPYMWIFPEVQDALDGLDNPEENRAAMLTNADLYTYLIELKGADCGYLIVSTDTTGRSFAGLEVLNPIKEAAEYAGIEPIREILAKELGVKGGFYEGDTFASGKDGNDVLPTVSFNENGIVTVTDVNGSFATVSDNRLAFILFEEDGSVFDATQFDLSEAKRNAQKIYFESVS